MFRVRRRGLAHDAELLRQRRIRKQDTRKNRNGNHAGVAAQAAAFALLGVDRIVPAVSGLHG